MPTKPVSSSFLTMSKHRYALPLISRCHNTTIATHAIRLRTLRSILTTTCTTTDCSHKPARSLFLFACLCIFLPLTLPASPPGLPTFFTLLLPRSLQSHRHALEAVAALFLLRRLAYAFHQAHQTRFVFLVAVPVIPCASSVALEATAVGVDTCTARGVRVQAAEF
jgi:hypothetical protein